MARLEQLTISSRAAVESIVDLPYQCDTPGRGVVKQRRAFARRIFFGHSFETVP